MRISLQVDYAGPSLSEHTPSSYATSERRRPAGRDAASRRSGRRRQDDDDSPARDWSTASIDAPQPRRPTSASAASLRSAYIHAAGDGKREFGQRWLAQLPRSAPSSASTSSLLPKRRTSNTLVPDELLMCSACNALMTELRYVCRVCHP